MRKSDLGTQTAKFLLITFFNENLFCSICLCINFYNGVYFLYLYQVLITANVAESSYPECGKQNKNTEDILLLELKYVLIMKTHFSIFTILEKNLKLDILIQSQSYSSFNSGRFCLKTDNASRFCRQGFKCSLFSLCLYG